jgi:hypothetical protein
MNEVQQHRRKVGTARPSHLMFTGGVGALIDLPNFPVLVRGLDDWRYDTMPDWTPLAEPRLLAAVGKLLNAPVKQLRPPPWMPEAPSDLTGQASRVGVPVIPFPQWLRCSACNRLAPMDSSSTWGFVNDKPRRPDEARFFHQDCPRRRNKPLAVAARFLLACVRGHLDDFPYREFVHRGGACPEATHPALTMDDYGGNRGANVVIRCTRCPAKRNISHAMGKRGEESLPRCRGRHPHLNTFEDCDARPLAIVVGASNTWFAQTLSALAVPATAASALQAQVARLWDQLGKVSSLDVLTTILAMELPAFLGLQKWPADEIFIAIEQHRKELAAGASGSDPAYPDLLTPEWDIFTSLPPPDPTDDFALYRGGVPGLLSKVFSDVVQAQRLREVRALAGFTRLDAPDPQDPDLVVRAPLARGGKPEWVPASEVRGEGIFLRLEEDALLAWESAIASSEVIVAHREAFGRFRENRYSDRVKTDGFDRYYGWPGSRYIALHTLAHLLIRTIALECGYSAASLSERIYAGEDRAGILIYTAVPDAEGTLGGLVSLAEPEPLTRIMDRSLRDARRCSSDPLCAERLPKHPADFLHGAACHACLFVSETTCERGNRFLDRRFIVSIDPRFPALIR